MYEESVAVPLIAAGPGLPAGVRASTSVSLLDLYPFIMASVGAVSPEAATPSHPGSCITKVLQIPQPQRVVFSEYHGMGSKTAAYMLRKGRHKLVHYADYEPQLFDLEADPEELSDLSRKSDAKPILDDLEAELYRICDPEEVAKEPSATSSGFSPRSAARTSSSSAAISDFHRRQGMPGQFS